MGQKRTLLQRRAIRLCIRIGEATEHQLGDARRLRERLFAGGDRNGAGEVARPAEIAGAEAGEGERCELSRRRQHDRGSVTARKACNFRAFLARRAPHRRRGVNDEARRQIETGGDGCAAFLDRRECVGETREFVTGGHAQGAVDAAAWKKLRVGGVHHCVERECFDVGHLDFEPAQSRLWHGRDV